MTERRASLLDHAIAASAAVVPVLIGIVALVAWIRPADPESVWRQGRDDRYVSVRHVAALKTFERAVVRRSDGPAPAIDAAQVLAGIEPCRREWSGGNETMVRLRHALVDTAPMPSPADEIAAHLAELDAQLLRFSTRANARVEHPVGLDATRWFAAALETLATPVESAAAPGRQFRVRCADLARALGVLRRGDGRILESLAWRGSEGMATLARWRADQEMQVSAHDVTRRNPWGGAAGCIYFGTARDDGASAQRIFVAGPKSIEQRLCVMPALSGVAGGPLPAALSGEPRPTDAADDPRWQVPPSLFTLLEPLESLRQPGGAMYRSYTDAGAIASPLGRTVDDRGLRNRTVVDGAPIDVGYSIDLTIDPAMQALAQKTAACYTGRHEICRALDMRRAEDGDRPLGSLLLEGAMVRLAAIAVIDVATGRIEALAGTLSPCARQEADGPGRDRRCDDRLPAPARFRADALLNPAVFHDAMPASTIKPILAAAFLADPANGQRLLAGERAAMQREDVPARESLRGQLMRSDSARFLDRMFCAERSFVRCGRPWEVQAAASAFGWNGGCVESSADCGKVDLLFGRPPERFDRRSAIAPAPTAVTYGRLLSAPSGPRLGSPMHLMPSTTLNADILRRCAAGADGRRVSDDDWERCRGGAVVDVVAEGWGQGHARASALGVAGMMATIAAAANGETMIARPHLVASVHGMAAADDRVRADALRWAAPPVKAPLGRDAAEIVLSGLSYSHRAGTARTACEQVFDAKRCRGIDWLAGKTGTPSFPGDGLTLDAIAQLCRDGGTLADAKRGICGSLRPYKWYVATYRADRAGHGPWTKAIAVLTERNWLIASGRIHGAGDTGPNPAAEIALQIVSRQSGFTMRSAP